MMLVLLLVLSAAPDDSGPKISDRRKARVMITVDELAAAQAASAHLKKTKPTLRPAEYVMTISKLDAGWLVNFSIDDISARDGGFQCTVSADMKVGCDDLPRLNVGTPTGSWVYRGRDAGTL